MDDLREHIGTVISTAGYRRAIVVVAVLLIALFGYSRYSHVESTSESDRNRVSVVAAAKTEVASLLSINTATAQADIDRLVGGATQEFRIDLTEQAKGLLKAAKGSKAHSSGTVVSAGLEKYAPDQAVVLVAANRSATGDRKKSVARYQIRVTLDRNDQHWLVSSMEALS